MKKTKYQIELGVFCFFTTVFGASLKLWHYPYGNFFLLLGLISMFVLMVSLIPRENSFLDRFLK